jgi:hypothetical protein
MGITEQGRGNSIENLREPNLKSAKICLQTMSILFTAYTDGISERKKLSIPFLFISWQ